MNLQYGTNVFGDDRSAASVPLHLLDDIGDDSFAAVPSAAAAAAVVGSPSNDDGLTGGDPFSAGGLGGGEKSAAPLDGRRRSNAATSLTSGFAMLRLRSLGVEPDGEASSILVPAYRIRSTVAGRPPACVTRTYAQLVASRAALTEALPAGTVLPTLPQQTSASTISGRDHILAFLHLLAANPGTGGSRVVHVLLGYPPAQRGATEALELEQAILHPATSTVLAAAGQNAIAARGRVSLPSWLTPLVEVARRKAVVAAAAVPQPQTEATGNSKQDDISSSGASGDSPTHQVQASFGDSASAKTASLENILHCGLEAPYFAALDLIDAASARLVAVERQRALSQQAEDAWATACGSGLKVRESIQQLAEAQRDVAGPLEALADAMFWPWTRGVVEQAAAETASRTAILAHAHRVGTSPSSTLRTSTAAAPAAAGESVDVDDDGHRSTSMDHNVDPNVEHPTVRLRRYLQRGANATEACADTAAAQGVLSPGLFHAVLLTAHERGAETATTSATLRGLLEEPQVQALPKLRAKLTGLAGPGATLTGKQHVRDAIHMVEAGGNAVIAQLDNVLHNTLSAQCNVLRGGVRRQLERAIGEVAKGEKYCAAGSVVVVTDLLRLLDLDPFVDDEDRPFRDPLEAPDAAADEAEAAASLAPSPTDSAAQKSGALGPQQQQACFGPAGANFESSFTNLYSDDGGSSVPRHPRTSSSSASTGGHGRRESVLPGGADIAAEKAADPFSMTAERRTGRGGGTEMRELYGTTSAAPRTNPSLPLWSGGSDVRGRPSV